MRTSVKRAAAAVAVPMALGPTAALLVAQPAGAGYPGDYSGSGVSIRTGPYVSSTRVGLGYTGQRIDTSCYKRGDSVTRDGFTTNVWDYHTNVTTGVVGFSSAAYLDYPLAPPIPHC